MGMAMAMLVSMWRTVGRASILTGYGTRATFVVDKNGIIKHIEEGRTAIDPTGAYQACNLFDKKKAN